jgi:hypothetical protein
MRGLGLAAQLIVAALLVAVLSLSGCTTTIQPVHCQGGAYHCTEGSRDVKFCENEVVASEGADCADLGLSPSKHFCVVKREDDACADNHYQLKDRACAVGQYRAVREWRECSPGAPTFKP